MMEAFALSQVNPGDRKHKRKKAFVISENLASVWVDKEMN
jgi:hypothetical protein